jgi:hypothetical protein
MSTFRLVSAERRLYGLKKTKDVVATKELFPLLPTK